MKSLYLDPDLWDLDIDADGNIALADEPYRLAQDAATAIRTFIGECYYDTSIGVPYWSDILGQLPPIDLVKSHLAAAAKTVPGVVAAQVFLTALDDNRNISGQVQVTDKSGVISVSSF